ncbi:unnamed protein product [Linum trigynum]|uniref:Uncharacterized protein n=1 Tax=Linum trigynum TaxID=586398 RepID=A0AAV2DBU2_9ROSI
MGRKSKEIIKVHPNNKNLNMKTFTFYNELLKIFGKGDIVVGRITCGISYGPKSPKHVVHLEVFDTLIDLEDPRGTEIIEEIINEGVQMEQTAQPHEAPLNKKQPSNPNSYALKKAIRSEMNTNEAIANMSSQLGCIDIRERVKLIGLMHGKVIDVAMDLVDNKPKTRLCYAFQSEEDCCYFIKN